MDFLISFWEATGFAALNWQMMVMWLVVGGLLYLAIVKQFEPLLLVPISLGALIVNLPVKDVILGPPVVTQSIMTAEEASHLSSFSIQVDALEEIPAELAVEGAEMVRVTEVVRPGGLFGWFNLGIILEIFPPLIFMGVGALTDFGPLIANPRTLMLGAAAQFGIFATFLGAIAFGFTDMQAAAIGIIGGADGPTSIFTANKLAPDLLGAIAVAAYSYMALVPVIQPPIMRLLTTEKERKIRMTSLRRVTKLEKLGFAIFVMVFCLVLIPDSAPLIGMLFIGNIFRECGVTERLVKAAQNEIINVVTIFLGLSVGLKMAYDKFLDPDTLKILLLGVVAFMIATASGVLMAKFMNLFSKNKINPLIGSAGVSAVPMAARVSQVEGQKADPGNFLLMHAMGPNVAGVIGSALAAGYFIAALAGG